ncbi:site-specific integrase [Tritonibacter scottomollicae]|uniref:Site-specific recombinase XerD n=1 Tax=Tritonibacter scottomollicae TaxID=483013 RepID=A0A2T1AAI6_TRISK|nr:site-specific integrase [Tritonibacter scottomollicae]PRZ45611.1 site-specific recombinase XerD [Tritonibacter scottomollicae]
MKTVTLLTPLILSSLKPRKKEYVLHDAQCDGLALRIQPGGARSWVCWKREAGKTRRVTLGRFEDMDLDAAREAFHGNMGNSQRATGPLQRNTLPFGKLCTAFLDAKHGVYAASTISSLGYYLDTQLLPAFGPRKIARITTPEIAEWFYAYSRSRPGGANQALGHFTTILNWAREAGHLPEDFPNPAAPLRFNRRLARGRVLSSDQLRRLAAVLDSATARQRDAADAIWLMLLTGCRSGEILRLRWDEVRKDKLALQHTKTGPREVNLSDAAIQYFGRLRKQPRSSYVFPAQRTMKPHRTSIDHAWQTFKHLASLPDEIRLHDLRHTYASHAIMSGESLHMTGKLLGHRSPGSTERYAHLDAGFLEKAADKVAQRIDGLLGG